MNDNYSVTKTKWDNGHVKTETPLYKGRKQGIERSFDRKGVLIATSEYSDDLLDGYVKTYFSSGMIESLQYYKKGQPVDDLIIYNEDGLVVYSTSGDYQTLTSYYDDEYHNVTKYF